MSNEPNPDRVTKFVSHFKNKTKHLRDGGRDVENDLQIGLTPTVGWQRRNIDMLQKRIIPNIFTGRAGETQKSSLVDVPRNGMRVTWIGHASFLIEMGHTNIIVDPNWAMWHGFIKRARMPGLAIGDLPRIDLVLITHAHHDHMHRPSLRELADFQKIIVPRGVGSLVKRMNFSKVVEMELWETHVHENIHITFTPCQHWGARYVHDTHRGFGGFLIDNGIRNIFHCGDSAHFSGFKEIGRRFDIDLSLMPIGAYDAPSGREVHMNPEEALMAYQDIKAKHLIPMHYGTFPLGGEPMEEPPLRLRKESIRLGIEDQVSIPEPGQPLLF